MSDDHDPRAAAAALKRLAKNAGEEGFHDFSKPGPGAHPISCAARLQGIDLTYVITAYQSRRGVRLSP